MSFMKDPRRVWEAYLRETSRPDKFSYQAGQMAMALEIITQVKCLEELKGLTDAAGRAQAVSALETLLQDCGLYDAAYEMYEHLSQWRRPRFVPVVLHEHVPLGIAVVVGPDEPRIQGLLTELSSEPSSPEEEASLGDRSHALLPERRDPQQDPEPSASPEEASS